MEVETFELRPALCVLSLLNRLAAVYLQGCLGSYDDCALDIVARQESFRFSLNCYVQIG